MADTHFNLTPTSLPIWYTQRLLQTIDKYRAILTRDVNFDFSIIVSFRL